MDKDLRTRNAIQQIVSQEIDKIALEARDVVKEAVRSSLLPQLRAAIRDSISEAMEEMLTEETTTQEAGISEAPPSPEEEMPKVEEEPVPKEVKTAAAPSEVEVPPEEEMPKVEEEPVPKEVKTAAAPSEAELPTEEIEVSGGGDGRYAYGIADAGVSVSLGNIGIEDNEVYTIPYKGLCAVVHNCPTEPYQSDNQELVKGWVRTHQNVLDAAIEKFGTVLPLGFDTIIQGEDNTDPKQQVKDFIKDDFENLKEKMEKVRGKQEFGVQISYDNKAMTDIVARESEEVGKLKEEMASQKPGMAYMYKQKIEKAVKGELEKSAEGYFKDFYGGIKNHVDDIKVEKAKSERDKTMLMNLSCLVLKERVEDLGNELERIDYMNGFSVRFTGPWPPYSFV